MSHRLQFERHVAITVNGVLVEDDYCNELQTRYYSLISDYVPPLPCSLSVEQFRTTFNAGVTGFLV